MKFLRYILGMVLVFAACLLTQELRESTALQMFLISPAKIYAVMIAGVSLFVLGAGYCFGSEFRRQDFPAKITTVIFALLIIVQESVLLFGGVVNSNFLMWMNMWIPNMTIATYLAAFLTGMVWGSKK